MKIRPDIALKQHPIYTGKYNIQTNSIDDASHIIEQWIDDRIPGGIVYGKARVGKTRAIYNLSIALKEAYGSDLPVFVFNMSEHKPGEKYFFLELLKDLQHSFVKPNTIPSELKTRVINFMITSGKACNIDRIILIIDEANFLHPAEFNYLIDIYNRIELAGIQLSVILVGTDEILSTKALLIQMHKQQIVGRFMVREYRFYGVRSIKDLQICLASYDYSEYPLDSGWSFTKYFFPEAYEDGKRMNQMAEILFDCFTNIYTSKNEIEIPMQYVKGAIENCFRKFGYYGLGIYFPTRDEWESAVKDSGYADAEVVCDLCVNN